MAALRSYQVKPDANIHEIVQAAAQNLASQGFQCTPQPLGPQSASITVTKDRDGIQNFIGLGLECRVSMSINGAQLQVSIDSEWSNKIIAIAVGWFICMIPFFTGIIGCINQNSLPEKIFTAINVAVSSSGNGGANPYFQQAPQQQYAPQPQQYQAPQQYAPQPQQYQAPQAPQVPQDPQNPQA